MKSFFKKLIFIIFLINLITSVCKSNNIYKNSPQAIKGVIDLSSWDFDNNGNISLDGEWEFYWLQLIQPESFNDKNISSLSAYFTIPGLWNGFNLNGEKLSGQGFATFKLKILIKDEDRLYSLQLGRIETAYKLWINDKLLAGEGKVAKTSEEMVPCWRPQVISFKPDSNVLDLVIQISNFKHRKGGIAHKINFGTPEKINRNANMFLGFDIFLLGILFIMAVYHFGLYALRRKDKSTLYFGLVCLFTGIYIMANGEFVLVQVFPGIPWELLVKINFISNYARLAALTFFLGFVVKEVISWKFITIIYYWALIMCLFVIVTPAKIYTHSLILIIIASAIILVYLFTGLIRGIYRRIEGAFFSFLGTVILFFTIVNDTLHDFSIIHTLYLIPLGVFVFIFFQSFMLSFRSARSYNSVERLSKRFMTLNKIKNEFLSVKSYDLNIPLQIIIDNSGAEKGALIISENNHWCIKAFKSDFEDEIQRFKFQSLEDEENSNYPLIPFSIISDVIDLQESLIINSKGDLKIFFRDNYMREHKVKSLYCMPLFEGENIKGALYLESRTETDVFDEERIQVLDLLSSQISTLIDNSNIYNALEDLNKDLEDRVTERTAEVYQQKEEILAQRDEIESANENIRRAYDEIASKNREMTDSINYARRIQESILPSEDFMKKIFPEMFIFFKPKDILSGDFYWIEQAFIAEKYGDIKKEKLIFAAVDCTGHGVPGALMSIIGNDLLNYAINDLSLTKPSDILNVLEAGIRIKLKQTEKSRSQDGMDIAIITYEPTTKRLQCSSANSPVYLVRENNNRQIEIIDTSKYSIGGFIYRRKNDKVFNTVELTVNKGDIIYLSSDGYADQVGGLKKRKFMKKQFKELLLMISPNPIDIQKDMLDRTLINWKGSLRQIDDIMVIGIRFV